MPHDAPVSDGTQSSHVRKSQQTGHGEATPPIPAVAIEPARTSRMSIPHYALSTPRDGAQSARAVPQAKRTLQLPGSSRAPRGAFSVVGAPLAPGLAVTPR